MALLQKNNISFQFTDRSHPYEVSEHFISNKKVEIHSKDPLKVDTDYLISSVKDALLIQDKPVNDYNLSKGEVAASSMGNDYEYFLLFHYDDYCIVSSSPQSKVWICCRDCLFTTISGKFPFSDYLIQL